MKKRILFVCTGNLCRSVMAEALARRRLADRGPAGVEVASAGVAAEAGRRSPGETLLAMTKLGLDGAAHRAKPLTAELVDWADLILAMERSHQMWIAARFPRTVGKVKTLKGLAGLPGSPDVADPYGTGPEGHGICAAEIARALDRIFDLLKEEKG